MANFAALIQSLAISGSRKSDGTANASGKVYAYLPDTTTTVALYADAAATVVATQPITLDTGGRIPPADFPDGLFCKQAIRLLVQDSTGATVSDSVFVPSTAGATGYDPDQTNAAFTSTNVNDILQNAGLSLGGLDWNYKESTGATQRTVKAKFAEIQVSVKDFGAVGDGVAIDTTAIQTAINRVKALGGGVVWFPGGTYKIDQALTLTSGTGVIFRGAGMGATTIISNHATANMFTLSSCTSIAFEGMNTKNSGTSTGSVFSLTSVTAGRFEDVGVNGFDATAGTYRFGVSSTSSGPLSFRACRMTVVTGDAAARCVKLTASSGTVFLGGFYSGNSGSNWELTGATSSLTAVGVQHNGGAVLFPAGLTLSSGYRYAFIGGTGLQLSVATATLPYIILLNCSDVTSGSQTTGATGSAQTPVLYLGREVTLTAASGGAGTVVVNNPAILPGTDAGDTDLYWDFVFKNAAGGAVTWDVSATAWAFASAIPTTAAHTISVRLRWDRTTSKLREVSRADTVT